MKAFLSTFFIMTALMMSSKSYAALGNSSGGGGDASESRVSEIRIDILRWITNGGAKKLTLPETLSYEEYFSQMTEILKPHAVVVGFTNDKVLVKGVEKTCRGYIENSTPYILCNIDRFAKTDEALQYSLVHHEYAGLARVESNKGASSDYIISDQLTGYLDVTEVLKLSVRDPKDFEDQPEDDFLSEPNKIIKDVRICAAECADESLGHRGHGLAYIGTITYARAGDWTTVGGCLSEGIQVPVYSDRLSDQSQKACINALAGKYWNKSVTIQTKNRKEEDSWFFSIEVNKKKK